MRYEYNNGSTDEQTIQNRFTAYLKVSVNHHRTQYIHRLRRQQQQEVPLEDSDAIQADSEHSLPDAQLRAVLSQLPERTQLVLLEHILGDKPLIQIARELDMPYPTVKAIYRRALEKLRKELRDEFY